MKAAHDEAAKPEEPSAEALKLVGEWSRRTPEMLWNADLHALAFAIDRHAEALRKRCDEQVGYIQLIESDRCDECNGELSQCGAPNVDGEPSMDCALCKSHDALTDARTRIATLEKALAPFASLSMGNHMDELPDAETLASGYADGIGPVRIKHGDCRRARAVLEEGRGK